MACRSPVAAYTAVPNECLKSYGQRPLRPNFPARTLKRFPGRRGAERPPTVEVVESSKRVQSCARQWNDLPFRALAFAATPQEDGSRIPSHILRP